MADCIQHVIPVVAATVRQEASTSIYYRTAQCTEDFGRVLIGGACGSVKANNKDKVRVTAQPGHSGLPTN